MIYALADKIKMDCIAIKKDYERDIISKDFMDGVLISCKLTLEDIEEMWDVDLSEYFVEE